MEVEVKQEDEERMVTQEKGEVADHSNEQNCAGTQTPTRQFVTSFLEQKADDVTKVPGVVSQASKEVPGVVSQVSKEIAGVVSQATNELKKTLKCCVIKLKGQNEHIMLMPGNSQSHILPGLNQPFPTKNPNEKIYILARKNNISSVVGSLNTNMFAQQRTVLSGIQVQIHPKDGGPPQTLNPLQIQGGKQRWIISTPPQVSSESLNVNTNLIQAQAPSNVQLHNTASYPIQYQIANLSTQLNQLSGSVQTLSTSQIQPPNVGQVSTGQFPLLNQKVLLSQVPLSSTTVSGNVLPVQLFPVHMQSNSLSAQDNKFTALPVQLEKINTVPVRGLSGNEAVAKGPVGEKQTDTMTGLSGNEAATKGPVGEKQTDTMTGLSGNKALTKPPVGEKQTDTMTGLSGNKALTKPPVGEKQTDTMTGLSGNKTPTRCPVGEKLTDTMTANETVVDADPYPLCKKIGLHLDVKTKSSRKQKLDTKVLTNGLILEIHRYGNQVDRTYSKVVHSHVVLGILDDNFDLGLQNKEQKLNFSKAIARRIQRVYSQFSDLATSSRHGFCKEVFVLPFPCNSSRPSSDSCAGIETANTSLVKVIERKRLTIRMLREKCDTLKQQRAYLLASKKKRGVKLQKAYSDNKVLFNRYNKVREKLSSLCVRDVNKRIKRRDERIRALEKELAKSSDQQEKNTSLSKEKAHLEQEKALLLKENATLKLDTSLLREEIKSWKSAKQLKSAQLHDQKKQLHKEKDKIDTDPVIVSLREQVRCWQEMYTEVKDELDCHRNKMIRTRENGRYKANVRELYMDLISDKGVSCSKVSKIVGAVLDKMLGMKAEQLPSESKSKEFILEARHVSLPHVKEAISEVTDITLCTDGTTKFGHKYGTAGVYLKDGSRMHLGITEQSSRSAMSQFNIVRENIQDIVRSGGVEEGDDERQEKEIFAKITNLFGDRATTEKKFNQILNEYREEILPDIFEEFDHYSDSEKVKLSLVNEFFCGLHLIDGFAHQAKVTLQLWESMIFGDDEIGARSLPDSENSPSESGTVRLIRTVSDAVQAKGCAKNGKPVKFKTFLTDNGEFEVVPLAPFRGNRINILFHNAAGVYSLHEDLVEFAGDYLDDNSLFAGVSADLEVQHFKAGCRALGLVSKVITGPLWRALSLKEHVLNMNARYQTLAAKLKKWQEDGKLFVEGKVCLYDDVEIHKDQVFEKLIKCTDSEFDDLTVQIVELLLASFLKVCCKMLADHLEHGRYEQVSDGQMEKMKSTPKTNVSCERDFGVFDNLLRAKTRATSIALEGIIMFKANRTWDWLSSMDKQKKESVLRAAQQSVKQQRALFRERQSDTENTRLKLMKEKKRQNDQLKSRHEATKKRYQELAEESNTTVTKKEIFAEHDTEERKMTVIKNKTLAEHDAEEMKMTVTKNKTLAEHDTEERKMTVTKNKTLAEHDAEERKMTVTKKETLAEHDTEERKMTVIKNKTLAEHDAEERKMTVTKKKTLDEHDAQERKMAVTKKKTLAEHDTEEGKMTVTKKKTLAEHDTEERKMTVIKNKTLAEHDTEGRKMTVIKNKTLAEHDAEERKMTVTKKETLAEHDTEEGKMTVTKNKTLAEHDTEERKMTVIKNKTLAEHDTEGRKMTVTKKKTLAEHDAQERKMAVTKKKTLAEHDTEEGKMTVTKKKTLAEHDTEERKMTVTKKKKIAEHDTVKQTNTKHAGQYEVLQHKKDLFKKHDVTMEQLTSELKQYGGLWMKVDEIDDLLTSLEEDDRYSAVVCQLQYRRFVLGMKNENGIFSTSVSGRKLAVRDLVSNLKLSVSKDTTETETQVSNLKRKALKSLDSINKTPEKRAKIVEVIDSSESECEEWSSLLDSAESLSEEEPHSTSKTFKPHANVRQRLPKQREDDASGKRGRSRKPISKKLAKQMEDAAHRKQGGPREADAHEKRGRPRKLEHEPQVSASDEDDGTMNDPDSDSEQASADGSGPNSARVPVVSRPDQLLGKRIKHAIEVNDEHEWYTGTVVKMREENGEKVFQVNYDEFQMDWWVDIWKDFKDNKLELLPLSPEMVLGKQVEHGFFNEDGQKVWLPGRIYRDEDDDVFLMVYDDEEYGRVLYPLLNSYMNNKLRIIS